MQRLLLALGTLLLFGSTSIVAQESLPAQEMVAVPAGTFLMGSPNQEAGRNGDERRTETTIGGDFRIGRHEVTNAEAAAVYGYGLTQGTLSIDASTSTLRLGSIVLVFLGNARIEYRDGYLVPAQGYERHPLVSVTWYGAAVYCNLLSEMRGLRSAYVSSTFICDFSADGYRLPTEAEWEYAARGADRSRGTVYSGGNRPGEAAWYAENSGGMVHPVGRKAPNELSLCDMSGNVTEWCNDWYDLYPEGSQMDPRGPANGGGRILRGGAWNQPAVFARVAARSWNGPSNAWSNVGFRVVLP